MIVSSVVPVLCPYLCLTVETHNGTTVFPVGPVAVFISPENPPLVLCAIVCVRRPVKWVRCAFASLTVHSVGFSINRLV